MIQGAKVFTRLGKKNLRSRNDEHTGNLLQSMRWKAARRSVSVYAGFERSYKFQALKGVGNHAHLVDRGTKIRKTKAGKNRGIMPASYFWTDTRNEGGGEALRHIEIGIRKMVENLKMEILMLSLEKLTIAITARNILLQDSEIQRLVGSKIFPSVAPTNTPSPHITYERDAYEVESVKMGAIREVARLTLCNHF